MDQKDDFECLFNERMNALFHDNAHVVGFAMFESTLGGESLYSCKPERSTPMQVEEEVANS
jgi:hypothetical protein